MASMLGAVAAVAGGTCGSASATEVFGAAAGGVEAGALGADGVAGAGSEAGAVGVAVVAG